MPSSIKQADHRNMMPKLKHKVYKFCSLSPFLTNKSIINWHSFLAPFAYNDYIHYQKHKKNSGLNDFMLVITIDV